MDITSQTKIRDLLEAYPSLKEWLAAYSPEFAKLSNPVLYNTVARVATIEAAAGMGSVDVDRLLDDIRTEIARQAISAEETAGAAPRLDDAERSRRQEILKGLVHELHGGADVADIKERFHALVRDVDSAEIARMEQALIAEGMPASEIQRLCDVHVAVFKESLDKEAPAAVAPGHPIDAYLRENAVIAEISGALRSGVEALGAAEDDAARSDALAGVVRDLDRLAPIEIHYTRKENQLFPALEQHDVEGPTKVMWGLDDDIRARIKSDRAHAGRGDIETLLRSLPETLSMVDDMIYKEEKILFPTALQVITEEEWSRIGAGDAEIGYAWIDGADVPTATATAAAMISSATETPPTGELLLPLSTGALAAEQIELLLAHLPFDVTYVDEDDRVRFYSEGDRVFPRSPGVIGREVRNCHPPASVHKVEEILAEFKAGTKDQAEFWIDFRGRFIHIRYFAMRDTGGVYRGCLEVVQDATHVRALEGQRRIVDW